MKTKIYVIAAIVPVILLGIGAMSSSECVIDIVPDILPDGGLDDLYYTQLEALGSVPPNTWAITGGSLPPGVSLGTLTGLISGTPTAAGTYDFSVKVTDSLVSVGEENRAIVVNQLPLDIRTISIHNGTAGTPYQSVQFRKLGGDGGPYTWSQPSGTLPPGLTFSATGLLSGTPTTDGTYTFSIQVQDGTSIYINSYMIKIADLSPWQILASDPSLFPYVDCASYPKPDNIAWKRSDLSVVAANGRIYSAGGRADETWIDINGDEWPGTNQAGHSIYHPTTDIWDSAYWHDWSVLAMEPGGYLVNGMPTGFNNAFIQHYPMVIIGDSAKKPERGEGAYTGNNQCFAHDWDNDGTDEIFLLSGYPMRNGSLYIGSWYMYDSDTNSWSKTVDRPGGGLGATRHSCGLLWEKQKKVMHYGGYSNGPEPDRDNYYFYDIATDTWSGPFDGPIEITQHCGETIDDKAYFISGNQGGTDFSTGVIICDLNTDTWDTTTAAPIPVGVNCAASVAWAKRIYVIGGQVASGTGETDNTDIIQEYNPATNSWTKLAITLPERRSRHGAAILDDVLYVTSGRGWNATAAAMENKNDLWAISMYDHKPRPQFYDITYNWAADSVTLYWTGQAGMPYAIKHADGEYDEGLVWSVLADNLPGVEGANSYTDTGGPIESGRYYQVAVAGTSNPSQKIGGAWRLRLKNSMLTGQNEIGWPLIPVPTPPTPNPVIGPQGFTGSLFPAFADKLWHWNPATQSWDKKYLHLTNGWTLYGGSSFNIEMGIGYRVLLAPPTQDGLRLGLVGWVNKMKPFPVPIALVTVLNFVSWPYAKSVSLDDSGLLESGFIGNSFYPWSDKVWFWNFATRSYDRVYYDPFAGEWRDYPVGTPTTRKLKPGEGFWILTCPYSSLPPVWYADP